MGEHEKQMIEDIATIKADVRHLVKVVEEERAERKSQDERITVLEKSRIRDVAYATGFGAGAAMLFTMLKDKIFHLLASMLVVAAFTGCVSSSGLHSADAWWHAKDRPVTVAVDMSMRDECAQATLDALDFWADQGVDYLRAQEHHHRPRWRPNRPQDPGDLRNEVEGQRPASVREDQAQRRYHARVQR
jgi:hypothetical protein